MMTTGLRQLLVVVLLIGGIIFSTMPSGSAFAQFQPKIDLSKGAPVDPVKEERRKEVDKEYQSKLKAIPDQPQKKVDPWANVRSSNPSPK
jgi:hypothetical protein